jgi:hypothetical protein
VFSGGGLQTNGTQAIGTATYTCVSATIVGGFSGNGYKLNDQIIVNANTGVILQVSELNQTFTANTTNGQANLTNVADFRNIAANVAITGAGIPPGTTILSFSASGGTITMSANAQATASGVTVTYTTADNTGPIGGLIISSGGTLSLPLGTTSYATSPIIGIGDGARVIMGFGVGGINVTNFGDGYTSSPNVSFNPTGGGSNTTVVTTITALTGDNPKVIEAWTRDAGANVYLRYIGEYN